MGEAEVQMPKLGTSKFCLPVFTFDTLLKALPYSQTCEALKQYPTRSFQMLFVCAVLIMYNVKDA